MHDLDTTQAAGESQTLKTRPFTEEQIAALRVAADCLIERYAAPIRAILRDAEHASVAQPIYQVRPRNGAEWSDVSEAEYKICGGAGYVQRIVYAARQPATDYAALHLTPEQAAKEAK